jgi:hypothetical protein
MGLEHLFGAIVTSIVTAFVTLAGVYMKWHTLKNKAKIDVHDQVVNNYAEMLARSEAQQEAFRAELTQRRQDVLSSMERQSEIADQRFQRERQFFAEQMALISKLFCDTMREERQAHTKDTEDTRRIITQITTQHAEEHRALVDAIASLRSSLASVKP